MIMTETTLQILSALYSSATSRTGNNRHHKQKRPTFTTRLANEKKYRSLVTALRGSGACVVLVGARRLGSCLSGTDGRARWPSGVLGALLVEVRIEVSTALRQLPVAVWLKIRYSRQSSVDRIPAGTPIQSSLDDGFDGDFGFAGADS